jgi:regulator of cell morphogenesis and NO signaling
MTRIDANAEVGAVVAESPSTSRVFERYGIDYCCAGRRRLADACASRGLDTSAVLKDLEEAAATSPPADGWDDRPVSELLDHILGRHHAYLHAELPRLQALMDKVARVHGDRYPNVVPELAERYGQLHEDLVQHMVKEEQILFPSIRAIETGRACEAPCADLTGPVEIMEWEHEECGRTLARMREVTHAYAPPEGACASLVALFAGLQEMETDLHRHIHLENRHVHPRALALSGADRGR